jgi:hypothetical protein
MNYPLVRRDRNPITQRTLANVIYFNPQYYVSAAIAAAISIQTPIFSTNQVLFGTAETHFAGGRFKAGSCFMADGYEIGLILEEGKAAHLRHNASLQKHFDLISPIAIAAIRAPAFAAVGGIIASLGYYSVNYARLNSSAEQIQSAIFWFFIAIFLSVLAPGLTYVSRYAQTQAMAEQDLDFTNPYVHDNRRSKHLGRLGQLCHLAGVASILASYAALILGGAMFLQMMD